MLSLRALECNPGIGIIYGHKSLLSGIILPEKIGGSQESIFVHVPNESKEEYRLSLSGKPVMVGVRPLNGFSYVASQGNIFGNKLPWLQTEFAYGFCADQHIHRGGFDRSSSHIAFGNVRFRTASIPDGKVNSSLSLLHQRGDINVICPSSANNHFGAELQNERFIGDQGLMFNGFQGSISQPDSDPSNTYQDKASEPSNPIHPVFPKWQIRQLCDPDGAWFICAGWLLSAVLIGIGFGRIHDSRRWGWFIFLFGVSLDIAFGVSGMFGCLPWYWGRCDCECKPQITYQQPFHRDKIVPQKYLTRFYYCGTVIDMANVLNTDKQIAVIGALAEGSSIRSIERMTGVHRDTIMRLGVKVGQGCACPHGCARCAILPCTRLEMDEIWGFVGKKERQRALRMSPAVGNVWTFCAIDAETKLVPAFKVGDRSIATANAFVQRRSEPDEQSSANLHRRPAEPTWKR